MNRTIRFILFIITLALLCFILLRYFDLIVNLLPGQTERVKYERSIKRNFDDIYQNKFRQAAKLSLNDYTIPDLPFIQSGFFLDDRIEAFAHRINLSEGEKLMFELESDSARIFCEVFRITGEEPSNWLIYHTVLFDPSGNENDILSCFETGEYLVRFQPELGITSGFSIYMYKSPLLSFPVKGKDNKAIQSLWGAPRGGGKRKHEGIDIFAPKGTPILSVEDGKVTSTKIGGLGGKTVWVRSNDGRRNVYYAHLDEQKVKTGQYVKAGDLVGTVGNTGNAKTTPPHLHFGIYKRMGGAIDPYPWVAFKDKYADTQPRWMTSQQMNFLTHLPSTNMRQKPNVTGNLIFTLGKGTELDILGAIGTWFHVRTEDGIAGFISDSVVDY